MTQPDIPVISRSVAISQPHRVFFTDGAFAPGNSVMEAALRGSDAAGRKRKVLVVAEAALLRGQPELAGQLNAWFAARSGDWELVGEPMALEGGEACKNDWTLVGKIWEAVERAGIDRHSFVVAMGGGALLDLVGFASATAHRGVRHVRMPSTTLSQGDGGVGVKNGVNWFGPW
jgi:3-dehydroquinate synthase